MLFRVVPWAACGLSLALLAGCATDPVTPAAPLVAQPALQFVDLQRFDQELSGSLGAPLPRVEVSFYDRVVPSAMPERLQKWMAAVEAGGGKVKVTPPPSSVTTRSPIALISAISALWTANKMVREASTEAQFRVARAYDAEVVLRQDARGDTVIDKVVFVRGQR